MSARLAPEESDDGPRPPEEEEDELHPALDVALDLGLYGVLGSSAVALGGLVGLALGVRPYANAVLAIGIVAASVSMVLVLVVTAFTGRFSPFG